MKSTIHTFGCLSFVLAFVLGVLFITSSCEAISRNYAEAQRTEQVQIAETQTTERTKINADAMVETYRIQYGAQVDIAGIQADATKKTSFAFSAFYLVRALIWLVGLAVALWTAVFVKEALAKRAAPALAECATRQ